MKTFFFREHYDFGTKSQKSDTDFKPRLFFWTTLYAFGMKSQKSEIDYN